MAKRRRRHSCETRAWMACAQRSTRSRDASITSEGGTDPRALAAEALRAADLAFARWYS